MKSLVRKSIDAATVSDKPRRESSVPKPLNRNTNMDYKALLIGLLGLQPEATDEEITAASSSFQNDMVAYRNQHDEIVQAAQAATEEAHTGLTNMTEERDELQEELVNRDMDEYSDVIEEDDKEEVKAQLLANRKGTLKLLNSARKSVEKIKNNGNTPKGEKAGKLHNSADAKNPDNAKILNDDGKDCKSDTQQAAKIMNRARELQKDRPGMPLQNAFQQAQAEIAG